MARSKAAGYHGIQNMKFAPKTADTYAASIDMKYAKNLNPSVILEAAENHADNKLLFRVPNDQGYDGEIGSTGQDVDFEVAVGYKVDSAAGTITTSLVKYARGAVYYEFTEVDANGAPYAVKNWMYNVEIGKGAESHATDTKSIAFGTYTYPFTCYGDDLMDSAGTAKYLDANGMGRKAFIYTVRPSDTGYATFGSAVPLPKMAASGG